jgi:hypothetical protein
MHYSKKLKEEIDSKENILLKIDNEIIDFLVFLNSMELKNLQH